MNWKSPVFKELNYLTLLQYKNLEVKSKYEEKIVYQIYEASSDSQYFKSFQYSLYSLLKNTNARKYHVLVYAYGKFSPRAQKFFGDLHRLGIEVIWLPESKCLSKAAFLLNGVDFDSSVFLIDADIYFPTKMRIMIPQVSYGVNEAYFRPDSLEQLMQWKTNRGFEEVIKVLSGFEPFGAIDIRYWLQQMFPTLWINGSFCFFAEKFIAHPTLRELVLYLNSHGIVSDEFVFMIAANFLGASIGEMQPKLCFPTALNETLKGHPAHWSTRFDSCMANVKQLEELTR